MFKRYCDACGRAIDLKENFSRISICNVTSVCTDFGIEERYERIKGPLGHESRRRDYCKECCEKVIGLLTKSEK